MKNFTRKTMIAATSALLVCSAAQAHDNGPKGFTKAPISSSLHQLDRDGFVFADVNNDGLMDLFNVGMTNHGFVTKPEPVPEGESKVFDGYWPYGFLYLAQSDGTYAIPGFDRDEQKIMSTGLPSAVQAHMQFVDFNNDGNLDLFIIRPYEGDYGWMGGYYGPEENRSGAEVYINLGAEQGFKFQRMEGTPFVRPQNDNRNINEGQKHGSLVFGDYNNDGFIDVLMTGMEQDKGRFVHLYKNLGGVAFERQSVALPKEGDTYDKGLYVMDEDGFSTGVPTKEFKAMSHGSVVFGDLNNDGFLDIVCSGYSDDRGIDMRFYKNLQNGEFQDVTEDYAISNVYRLYENELKLIDINNDGFLDVLALGTPEGSSRGDAGGRKLGSILINNGDTGFTFTERRENETGLPPVSGSQVFLTDMDGDGAPDLLYKGWNPETSWNTFLVNYKTSQEQFVVDADFSHQGGENTQNSGFDFGFVLGDFDNDGALDMIEGGYDDHVVIWKNELGLELAETPVAPSNIVAIEKDGKLVITWEDDNNGDWTYYNILIKDASGKIVKATTHSLANGKLTTYPEFSTLVYGKTYSMPLPVGSYKVGVSAVKLSYQASEFATIDASVTVGSSKKMDSDAKYTVVKTDNGILVQGADAAVEVFSTSGVKVAEGVANAEINVNATGIYFVKVAGKTIKVIR